MGTERGREKQHFLQASDLLHPVTTPNRLLLHKAITLALLAMLEIKFGPLKF